MFPPEPSDPGAVPPPAPRALPKGYARNLMFSGNPLGLVGGIFFAVGLLLGVIFPTIGIATGLWLMLLIGGFLALIFTTLGGTMLYVVYQAGMNKVRPYKDGVAVLGEVGNVYKNPLVNVNGRNPYTVEYLFRADGRPFEGQMDTWSSAVIDLEKGQPLHVLYLPEDPLQNVIYPPL